MILTLLLVLCVLIWLPIFFYQIANRSFLVLLIWLLIAPVAVNVIKSPQQNPFFNTPEDSIEYLLQNPSAGKKTKIDLSAYLKRQSSITLKEVIEPTRTLLALLLGVFLLNALLKKERLAAFDRAELWMVVVSIIMVVNVLWLARRPAYSLRVACDAFIVPFLAYYITRRLVTSEERLRQLTVIMGYAGFYLIICALIDRLIHRTLLYRISGPLGTDNQLYIVIMTAFFMTLLPLHQGNSFVGEKTRLPPGVRWFVLGLVPVTVFATWARSNWLGFFSGIWVVLFLGRHLLALPRKLAMGGLVLLLVPIIALSAIPFMPDEIIDQRVTNERTVTGRLSAWLLLIQEGLKHPISGLGFSNSQQLLLEQEKLFETYKGPTSSAHNGLLIIFVELGAVGLFAYLAMVASILYSGLSLYRRSLRPQDQWRGIGVMAILIAHLVPTLTTTVLHAPSVSHIYVFACIGGIFGLYSRSQPVVVTSPRRVPYTVLAKGS